MQNNSKGESKAGSVERGYNFIKVGKDESLSQGPRRAHTKAMRQEDAWCVYGTVQRPVGQELTEQGREQ